MLLATNPEKVGGGISYMQACYGKLSSKYKAKKLGSEAALAKFAKKSPGGAELRQRQIDNIKKYTKDADVIYFATDPDREGEAISKHLYDILEKAKFLKGKETHRVVFNEITKNAVIDALKNPRTISISQWDAYLARRTLDYLMGYDISEFLWKKVSFKL